MLIRFRINYDQCIQGMQYLALRKPGITQDCVKRVFFFADRRHLVDGGRSISGNRYVAMKHGPVPYEISNLIEGNSPYSGQVKEKFDSRLRRETHSGKVCLWSKIEVPDFPNLSGSDIEYLGDSFDQYGNVNSGKFSDLTHDDTAYQRAMARPGENNDMNPIDWLDHIGTPEEIISSLDDLGVIDRRPDPLAAMGNA